MEDKETEFWNRAEKNLKISEFLKEYRGICEKYNLIVTSCGGCCDGEFILDVGDIGSVGWNTINGHIQHLENNVAPVS